MNSSSWTPRPTRCGRHTLKFGLNIARQRLFNIAAFDTKGTYTFNNFADYINNQPATLALALNTASFDARQVQQSYFFQDDFKVTKNLTLNLGMRYEYANAPFGFFGATDPAIQATLVPGPVQGATATTGLRAPAWRTARRSRTALLGKIFGDGVTVFRGGYGIAYDFLFYNILTVNGSNYPARGLAARAAGGPGQPVSQPGARHRAAASIRWPRSSTARSNLQSPTTHFYSASIQRQIRARLHSGNRLHRLALLSRHRSIPGQPQHADGCAGGDGASPPEPPTRFPPRRPAACSRSTARAC